MFVNYFQQGGPMMWMLFACSTIFVILVVERLWEVGICGRIFHRKINQAQWVCNKHVFDFFKEVPTSIGLLGTVLGVVQSFGLEDGRITAEAAGAGLGIACYTTVYGLSIAILAVVCEYVVTWMMPANPYGEGKVK